MALMGYFEARKGPFAFFTDVVFADLGFPGHLQVQRDIVTRLGPTIGIKLKAHAQLDYTSWTGAATFRIASNCQVRHS